MQLEAIRLNSGYCMSRGQRNVCDKPHGFGYYRAINSGQPGSHDMARTGEPGKEVNRGNQRISG
jgi:hypothetical protein